MFFWFGWPNSSLTRNSRKIKQLKIKRPTYSDMAQYKVPTKTLPALEWSRIKKKILTRPFPILTGSLCICIFKEVDHRKRGRDMILQTVICELKGKIGEVDAFLVLQIRWIFRCMRCVYVGGIGAEVICAQHEYWWFTQLWLYI